MKTTNITADIHQANDGFFHNIFDDKENTRDFMEQVLPRRLKKQKAAYKNDTEAILEIFKFWYERGFLENKDVVIYFLDYVSKTQGISRDQLKKVLDESNIDGGEIMQTLAQQMKEEFREEFVETMGPQLKDEEKNKDYTLSS